MFERSVTHRYDDPVDLIWIRAAQELGLEIERSVEAFAAYDGKGTLTISVAADFDADDCLAQMIFHEICHWLVAGRRGQHLEDWGLSNVDDRDLVYEHAAHRLQAALARPYGLRNFMAVTTDWRPYWDALPDDPLKDGEDPAIAIAQEGAHLARLEPFAPVLAKALSATATIADLVRGAAGLDSLWRVTRKRHRLGALLSVDDDLRCGGCAWAISEAVSESSGLGCRQHPSNEGSLASVNPDEPACERWEAKFSIEDCGSCGACCREGFDLLTVAGDDPFRTLHRQLIQLRADGEYCVARPEGVCAALDGDGSRKCPYRCRHYETRPKNCGEFEVAGEACLLARRRVGLSR